MSVTNVRLLGTVQAGNSNFLADQRYQLLAYLAYKNDWVNRDELAYLFWSDTHNEIARRRLRQLIKRLKALSLADTLEIESEKLRWHVTSDVACFKQALYERHYAEALEHYSGPFLQGLESDETNEFNTWLVSEREALHARWREAVLSCTQASKAVTYLERLLEYDPLDEEALQRYLVMLASSQQASRVAQVYQTFSKRLEHDLGLEPTSATEQLFMKIQNGELKLQSVSEVAIADSAKPSLPAPVTAMIGREVELSDIAHYLSEPNCHLLTLTGPGGIGKTRLALQAAYDLVEQYSGGVYFVPLEVLTSVSAIPQQLAESLGLILQAKPEPLEQLITHLQNKSVLLILDNFEHLIEGATFVADLVTQCPHLNVIVTSRERLNLEQEHLLPISGLPFPETSSGLTEVLGTDAARLFMERAKRVRPEFAVTEQDLPAFVEICQRLEGVPLALELAAIWIRVMPLSELNQELAKSFDLLESSSRNRTERHRSIRAAFDHSWTLLNEKEQAALRKLSVFRGGFTREAASLVTGTSVALLAALVDKSLLRVSLEGRYDQHPLLYHYSQEKSVEPSDEKKEVEAKHGEYFLRVLQQKGQELKSSQQKEALNTIGEELENMRAAWQWLMSKQKFAELRSAVEPLTVFFDTCRRCQEGITFITQTATHLRDAEPRHRVLLGTLLIARAWLIYRLGQYEEASQLAQYGLELLRPLEDYLSISKGLSTLGGAALRMGNYEQAKLHWEKALALAEEQQDDREISIHVGNLAIIDIMTGCYSLAKQRFHQVLTLSQKRADYFGMVATLNSLGILHLNTGEVREAQQRFEEGLDLARDINLLEMIPVFLGNLAEVALDQKEYAKAYDLACQALQKSHENTDYDRTMEAVYLLTLGKAVTAQGDTSRAHTYFVQALEVAWTAKAAPQTLSALGKLAELQAGQGQVEQAVGLLSFTLHHPAADQYDTDQTQLQLDKLRDQLSLEEMNEAIEHGKTMKLEEVVAEIIEQASSHPSVDLALASVTL
jgi:predicted ATPase/DNA-binding SARP family transcriptional activator